MKLFLFLLGMVAAAIIGYSFEPQMRYTLTGKVPALEKTEPRRVVVETGAPSQKIDPASYSADQLPEKITLKADAEIADAASDLKMNIPAGSKVNLVRLEGDNIIISPGAGPFEGTVPISQTDLLAQLAALPKNPAPTPAPADPPAMADTNTTSEEPATTPAAPEMTPEPAAPEPEPEATPEPEPAPTPEPAPVPEPAAPAVPDGPVDVVAVMQASIKAGAIKEFTFDQVLDWQASEAPETIDGESYQTGLASYKAETVFGVKTIQAKALIKGGQVVRWLWPKSGMEIK